jgi:hypothetical protein
LQPTQKQLNTFEDDARKTYAQSIPDLYPQTLFDQIQAILGQLRAAAQNK